jgi:hypothetical protein
MFSLTSINSNYYSLYSKGSGCIKWAQLNRLLFTVLYGEIIAGSGTQHDSRE